MSRLALALLGPLQVTLDGEPVTGFRYDKLLALLSLLAVDADRPHRRAALVGLLWPNQPETAARANLRQALATLRGVIGDRTAEPPFLLITWQSVRWNPAADYWLDVAAFETLVHTCRRHAPVHAGPCPACAQRYAQAVDLYHGDFLGHFTLPTSAPFEEWALLKREALQRQQVAALAWLVEYHASQGEYAQAEQYVRRQLTVEPWDEGAHRQLMRLLVLTNKRTHALAQFDRCRRILATELGVDPDPETLALVAQIRAQC